MRRMWIPALAVIAILVVAVVLVAGARGRKVTEPPPASSAQALKRLPAKRVARPEPGSCVPVAGGGYSCGACREDSECPEGSGCMVNLETGRTECQGSDCEKNEECEKGTYCRVVSRTSRGEPLRTCVPPGTRPAAAACDPDNAADPDVSCSGNMICVDGGCAPPCEMTILAEESPCPRELPCVQTDNGPGCTPTCKIRPCGEGKSCEYLSVEGPIALCTHTVGKNCLGRDGGCPEDHDCIVEINARAERTTFSCVPSCNFADGEQACTEGLVCLSDNPNPHCRRRCTPDGDPACQDGERCIPVPNAMDSFYCTAT